MKIQTIIRLLALSLIGIFPVLAQSINGTWFLNGFHTDVNANSSLPVTESITGTATINIDAGSITFDTNLGNWTDDAGFVQSGDTYQMVYPSGSGKEYLIAIRVIDEDTLAFTLSQIWLTDSGFDIRGTEGIAGVLTKAQIPAPVPGAWTGDFTAKGMILKEVENDGDALRLQKEDATMSIEANPGGTSFRLVADDPDEDGYADNLIQVGNALHWADNDTSDYVLWSDSFLTTRHVQTRDQVRMLQLADGKIAFFVIYNQRARTVSSSSFFNNIRFISEFEYGSIILEPEGDGTDFAPTSIDNTKLELTILTSTATHVTPGDVDMILWNGDGTFVAGPDTIGVATSFTYSKTGPNTGEITFMISGESGLITLNFTGPETGTFTVTEDDLFETGTFVLTKSGSEDEPIEILLDNTTLGNRVESGDSVTANGVTMTVVNVLAANGGNSGEVDDYGILFGNDAEFDDVVSLGISFNVDVRITGYQIGSREDVPAGVFFTISGPNGTSGQNPVPAFDGVIEQEIDLPYIEGGLSVLKAGETYTITQNLGDFSGDPLFNLEAIFVIPVVAESSFGAAAAAAGLTGDDALPDATPFNDGVPNLLKFAFNMNLAGPDVSTLAAGGNSGLPAAALDESGDEPVWRVEFIRRKGSGLSYTPQKSSTLTSDSFGPMTGTTTVTDIDDEWERVVVEEPFDPVASPSCFTRVEVVLPGE